MYKNLISLSLMSVFLIPNAYARSTEFIKGSDLENIFEDEIISALKPGIQPAADRPIWELLIKEAQNIFRSQLHARYARYKDSWLTPDEKQQLKGEIRFYVKNEIAPKIVYEFSLNAGIHHFNQIHYLSHNPQQVFIFADYMQTAAKYNLASGKGHASDICKNIRNELNAKYPLN